MELLPILCTEGPFPQDCLLCQAQAEQMSGALLHLMDINQ